MAIPVPTVGSKITASYGSQVANLLNSIATGARARTNAAQSITAGTGTNMNNGGSVAWTAQEDSGGYVSGSATATPITIPAGAAGVYQVGFEISFGAVASGRCFAQVMINGASIKARAATTTEDTLGMSVPYRLSVGDTIGVQLQHNLSTTVATGCDIFAYKIGN